VAAVLFSLGGFRSVPNYWLKYAFFKFIKASGLQRVRLHDLRHSHATHLLMANVHPKIVQERLGHAKHRDHNGPLHTCDAWDAGRGGEPR